MKNYQFFSVMFLLAMVAMNTSDYVVGVIGFGLIAFIFGSLAGGQIGTMISDYIRKR